MKCRSCDVILTDFEATRKYKNTGKPLDLCNSCYEDVAEFIHVTIRPDLLRKSGRHQHDIFDIESED